MSNYYKSGKYVLTQKGYEATPERIKHERQVGKPVGIYTDKVPVGWIKNGWVELSE